MENIAIIFVLRKNMVQTIADNDFFCANQAVIPRNLLKMDGFQANVRSFAFDQNFGLCFFGDHQVYPFCSAVQFNFFFEDNRGEAFLFFEVVIVQPVLPYPFFGRQDQPGFAHKVIDKKCIFVLFDSEIEFIFKIKLGNPHTLR